MDNGTTVEVFKSLNYCDLAKSSLVSKRFRNLIRTNRHRLALHYVSIISMGAYFYPLLGTTVFDKDLSPEEYNEWIIRNQYSKQIPLESQMAGMQTTPTRRWFYQFHAIEGKDCILGSAAFFVRADLTNENWPLFQHFIRLLTDPFIYLRDVSFDWAAQKDIFNLLTGIINPDRNRLQCHQMTLSIGKNALDFSNLITWAKRHLLCNKLEIHIYSESFNNESLNHDEALLDFILTGGHCTSAIKISDYQYLISNVLRDFAVKFMKFKHGDECKVVQSIMGNIHSSHVEVFKRYFGEFIVKEVRKDELDFENQLVFEFVNSDIDQKCQFTATYFV